jgi:predicted dinucleotide-binding enzyme
MAVNLVHRGVPHALKAAGAFAGKILFSCVNCLRPDFSGFAVGMTTSAAEEIVRQAPDARVVEALPPMAVILAADAHWLAGQQITTFYCGDAEAKAAVAALLSDLDLEPIDAYPRRRCRPPICPRNSRGAVKSRANRDLPAKRRS